MNLFTPNEPRPDDTGAEKKRKANKPVSAEKKSSDTAKKSFVAAKVSNILRRKSPNAENVSETQKPQNIEQYVKQQLEKNERNEQPAAESVDLKEIKKQFNRKRAQIPEYSNVQRYSPDISAGLTDAQVNERYSQFLFNDTNQKYSKSYASILIGNLCTFFNLLCVLAAIALAYSQAPVSQFLFVVIFALNLGFGIVTEIVAKRKIDKLSLLTVPTSKVVRNGAVAEVKSKEIVLDDIVVLSLGNQIPADCIVLDGVVEVNESLLTGESVPVKKEPGDLLYAGSFISSGTCKARADKVGKATYLNSLSAKAKKYKKPNSELMRSSKLIIYIVGILIIPIAALMFFVNWNNYIPSEISRLNDTIQRTVSIVIGMIPSGMLLLTSIALTLGIIRLMSRNTLVQDLYSLEMLARVNVLCLDKTGTITDGRMKVNDCMLLNNPTDYSVNEIVGSCLNSLQDNNQTSIALYNYFGHNTVLKASATLPFSSKRKLSAVTFDEIGTIAIGAPEFVLQSLPDKISRIINQYASMGLRVLMVAHSNGKLAGDRLPSGFKPLAIISIADNIRDDAAQTIRWFKENDVAIKIISGDNPVTVAEVARRVGVNNADKYISLEGLNDKEVASVANKYTVFGRVTPEQKAILVKTIKSEGNTVAMTGDGVNDILAMKEADCAVSVASGSDAAKNVSHIVLMDNNFSNMPNVVFEGRRVINNIQNSSSLYLMKTLFTTIFAVISIILQQVYPFKTNNMMLMEIFVIGVASFFLSLQPNKSRVQGKYLPYVLSRTIPCAIVLVLAVESTHVVNLIVPEYFNEHLQEMSVVIITFAGLVMLYRVCLPLNLYRTVLLLAMSACCILGVTVMPTMFFGEGYAPLDFVCILYVIVVVMLCVPLSGIFIKIFDRMRENKKNDDLRGLPLRG
ncbi:MAG TPA: HAD-IC family P-type ATPase [Candidatus Borkfalkia excrementipullorum]|nr:HAD-IC family P-type ATPase [Candidatus Borkfalkia excrementipullorum]